MPPFGGSLLPLLAGSSSVYVLVVSLNDRQDGKIWSQPQGRVSIETQGVLIKGKSTGNHGFYHQI